VGSNLISSKILNGNGVKAIPGLILASNLGHTKKLKKKEFSFEKIMI